MHRTLTIDGEPVRLVVARLTVRELDALDAGAIPRGSAVTSSALVPITRQQLALIDQHVDVVAGDILLDDVTVQKLSQVFGGQTDTINAIFNLLVDAQALSDDERHDLTVAARFLLWLAVEQRKSSSTSKWAQTGSSCMKCHELKLCAKRACGGTESKKPVWHDKKLAVRRCPVLSLTPDVARVIRLFEWTHDQADGLRPVFLPAAASLGDQEAWTVAALAHLRGVYHEVYQQRVSDARTQH